MADSTTPAEPPTGAGRIGSEDLVAQIPTHDPVTFGGIAGVLVVTTVTACLVPARRATRLDPLAALRSD